MISAKNPQQVNQEAIAFAIALQLHLVANRENLNLYLLVAVYSLIKFADRKQLVGYAVKADCTT